MRGSTLKSGNQLMSTTSKITSGLLTSMHARISPEFADDFDKEPEIATILNTISELYQSQEQFDIQSQQISLRKLLLMTSRTWRNMANSRISSVERNKPTTFRVIMKSRSGFLVNDEDQKKNQISVRDKRNKTQMSFNRQDIKDYVKSMRRPKKQQSDLNPQPSILKPEQKQLAGDTRKQKQQLSQTKTSQFAEQATIQTSKKVRIEELQRRIDQLIKLKLQYSYQLRQMEKFNLGKNTQETKEQRKTQYLRKIEGIDRQIDNFIDQIKNKGEGDQDKNQRLEDINKKIGIIQKVMAEGMTQSDIAKKGYYKFVNNHKPKAPHIKTYNHNMEKLREKANNILNKSVSTSINLQSTNQLSYKAPDKKSYATRAQKTAYTFRNQPLHRSTYNRQFLIYGSVPNYPYKESASQILPSYSPTQLKSLYTSEFTGKQVQRINFKELDCYRDKFKNIDIPMITNKDERKSPAPVSHQKSGKVSIVNVYNPMKTIRYKTEHYIQNLSTESQNRFTGQDNKMRSNIKHKNLHSLKYAYKACAHA